MRQPSTALTWDSPAGITARCVLVTTTSARSMAVTGAGTAGPVSGGSEHRESIEASTWAPAKRSRRLARKKVAEQMIRSGE